MLWGSHLPQHRLTGHVRLGLDHLLPELFLERAQPEAIRADWCSWERVTPQSEVIRAIGCSGSALYHNPR